MCGLALMIITISAVWMIWRRCRHRVAPFELYRIPAAHRRILIEKAKSYPPEWVKYHQEMGGW